MKTLLLVLLVALGLSEHLSAQTLLCSDPNMPIVTTGTGHVDLPPANSTQGGTIDWTWMAQRSGTGDIHFIVDVQSIRFGGGPGAIDQTSTLKVFDLITNATVVQGIGLGIPPCPASCDQPVVVTVAAPSCVTRNGEGVATRFDSCGDGCCVRYYSVCCPTGTGNPTVNLLRSESQGCGGGASGCEPTCP